MSHQNLELQAALDLRTTEVPNLILTELENESVDIFYTNDSEQQFRIIRSDFIDEIMCNELIAEPEVIGHFDSNFLSSTLEWPELAIKMLQDNNLHQELGQSVVDFDRVSDIQESHVEQFGYAEYFNGDSREVSILDETFLVFKLQS